jgi:hypothetical protein
VSDSGKSANRLISPALAIGLVVVSALSLVGFAALSAYAPDFRDSSDGQAHVLSSSAIGFAGLKILLENEGMSVLIDRGLRGDVPTKPSLKILTPPPGSTSSEIKTLCGATPCLVILPKWIVYADPIRRGRVMRMAPLPLDATSALLKDFSQGSKIDAAKGTSRPRLEDPPGWPFIPKSLAQIDSLRTLSGNSWGGILETEDLDAVVAQLEKTQIFVLADPDLMNTQGLKDEGNSALAMTIVDQLRASDGPVVFDVTLNGYRRSEDILRAMFAPPFLGATFCALMAALLIGFHAFVRFGAPVRSQEGFALGKAALVDNTAQLVRVMGREPQMGVRYAAAMRNLVLRSLGLSRGTESRQIDAVLAALERRGGDLQFSALSVETQRVSRRSDLVTVARKLFQWRERILHAR